MDNSAIVESTKHDESKSTSEKDRESAPRPEAALEMIEKLLPKICESGLGRECEVSVNFHVVIPPNHNLSKTKPKTVGSQV